MGAAAAAVAVGSMAGQYFAGKQQAKATKQAAQMQLQAAREALVAQERARTQAVQYAQPSMAELASLERLVSKNEAAYKTNLSQIDRQVEALSAVDPNIQEAGKQALQLLQGQEAKILEPMRNERTRQRRDLENQLASRLGPGWRTSSAGIEAMTRFDDATSNSLIQAQSQALGQMGNLFTQFSGARNQGVANLQNIFQTGLGGEAQVLQGQQNIQNRIVNAFTGNAPNAYGQVINAAGQSMAGQIAAAQNQQNLYGAIGNLGATAYGYQQQQQQTQTLADAIGKQQAQQNYSGPGSAEFGE